MKLLSTVLFLTVFAGQSFAQSGVFADGFELGHACRWSAQNPAADCSEAEITVTLPGDLPLTLIRIPAGTFWMGSTADERGREDQEDLHQVTLTADYYVSKHEITQAQWEAVMGSAADLTCWGGPYGEGSDYPVYCVSWNDIAGSNGFISRLNQLPGVSGFRLPTEAEWERAARAGTQSRFSHGDVLSCEDDCTTCALHDEYMWWCGNNTPVGTKPVGSRLPNGYGLFDMHGNTYEWVQDLFKDHLGTSPVVNPVGPATGFGPVLRGGGWSNDARYCRSANRFYTSADDYDHYIGFRIAKTAP